MAESKKKEKAKTPDAPPAVQEVSEEALFEEALRAAEQAPPVSATTPEVSEADILAEAERAPRPPPPDPGLLSTVIHGLGQGFYKQGYDELTGAMGRARGDLVGNGLRMPDGSVRYVADDSEAYRAARDLERGIEAGAREHRPKTAFVANMAGDLMSDAALRFMGVPVASTAYQVASGALSGLLGSDAELSTDNTSTRDIMRAAEATGTGGVMGYYLPKIGNQVARALPGTMARLREAFERNALDKTRKVLTSGADTLSNRVPVSDAAAREALDSGAVPIWGTTEGAFKRLETLAEDRGQRYADIVDRLDKLGVRGPEVEPLAQRLLEKAKGYEKNSGADKAVAKAFEAEADNIRAIAPREFAIVGESPMAVQPRTLSAPPKTRVVPPRDPVTKKFLPRSQWPKDYTPEAPPAQAPPIQAGPPTPQPIAVKPLPEPIPGPQGSRLPLTQAELIKRDLQAKAKYGKREDTLINEARKEIASAYREGIENAVEDAGAAAPRSSEVAGLAQEFKPVKQQLARTLEARDAAERGAARSAQRVGGAAGVNTFDVANAATATGSKGLPALMWAMAQRAWKERGPSTMANVYDLGAEAAGNLSRASYANPGTTQALARVFTGPFGRQFAASDTAENLLVPTESRDARVQRAIADYLLQRQQ